MNLTADSTFENPGLGDGGNGDTFAGVLMGGGNLIIGGTLGSDPDIHFGSTLNSLGYTGAIEFARANARLRLSANSVYVGGLKSFLGYGEVSRAVSGVGTVTLQPPAGRSFSYSGTLANGSGTLALVLNGAGSQTLSGASTFTGGTTIQAGTLVVGHANALGTSGAIVLGGGGLFVAGGVSFGRSFTFTGGRVGGEGTFASAVTVPDGGRVVPGVSVGVLAFNALTLNGGAVLEVEVDPLSGACDQIQVLNADGLSVGGSVSVYLFDQGTTNPMSRPGTYKLIQYTGSGLNPTLFTVTNRRDGWLYSFDLKRVEGNWFLQVSAGPPQQTTILIR
ncbi:MAG: autotransporter-associated beta strand repeat-containing protein [Kiritimatiellae bacterium]|nr:autotransporter-associated beta strand repeat-containing protein [Kiritimatiellia bacterium]